MSICVIGFPSKFRSIVTYLSVLALLLNLNIGAFAKPNLLHESTAQILLLDYPYAQIVKYMQL